MEYMCHCQPTAYLYPVSRDCGKSRQDIGVEGAVAVLMNTPHYLEFLIWRMSCGGDGILETNVYHFSISINGVTLTCLVYPAHLSLTTPHKREDSQLTGQVL